MFSPRLALELLRWRLAGRRARLWWRDDDAAGVSAPLFRLLAMASQHRVPLALAVVPSGDMEALGKAIGVFDRVTVVQHGIDHQNRRTGPVAGEFPHEWPMPRLQSEIQRGWRRIQDLPEAFPMFVPPWNDVHPDLETALAALDYRALSAGGGDASGRVARLDVELDLLRWRGGARFRGAGRFQKALCDALQSRRLSGRWRDPIGVLTHHLAHDEEAWRFLESFLAFTQRSSGFGWVSVRYLVDEAAPPPVRTKPRAPALKLAIAI